jgi:hypothetical protein
MHILRAVQQTKLGNHKTIESGSGGGLSILCMTPRSQKSIQLQAEFWGESGWFFSSSLKIKWPIRIRIAVPVSHLKTMLSKRLSV